MIAGAQIELSTGIALIRCLSEPFDPLNDVRLHTLAVHIAHTELGFRICPALIS